MWLRNGQIPPVLKMGVAAPDVGQYSRLGKRLLPGLWTRPEKGFPFAVLPCVCLLMLVLLVLFG